MGTLRAMTFFKEKRAERLIAKGKWDKVIKIGAPAIGPLTIALGNEDRHIREGAMKALDRIGALTIELKVKRYIADLKDNVAEKYVRHNAVDALGNIGPAAKDAVPYLIKMLKDEDTRHVAVGTLGRIGPAAKDAVSFLVQTLDDKSRHNREAAMNALDNIGVLTIELKVKRYVADLKDNAAEWYVRRNAASALGNIGPAAKDIVPILIETLKDKNEDVCRDTVIALWKIDPTAKDVVLCLIGMLKDEDVCRDAVNAFGRIGYIGPTAKEAVPILMEMLKKRYPGGVIRALGNIGPDAKEAVPYLIPLLDINNNAILESVASTLGAIGPDAKEAVPCLIATLKLCRAGTVLSPWFKYRLLFEGVDIIKALGAIGPDAKEAVPYLMPLLGIVSGNVGNFAAKALYKIGQPAVFFLIEALESKDTKICSHAEKILAKLNSLTPEARAMSKDICYARSKFIEAIERRNYPSYFRYGVKGDALERVNQYIETAYDFIKKYGDFSVELIDGEYDEAIDQLPIRVAAELGLDNLPKHLSKSIPVQEFMRWRKVIVPLKPPVFVITPRNRSSS